MSFGFPSLGHVEMNASAESLALHQMRLRDKKITAMIEVLLPSDECILLPVAHGHQTGIYKYEDRGCQQVSAAELEQACKGGVKQISVTPMQDGMGRLTWLSCESTRRDVIQGKDGWSQQLRRWKMEGMSGLVEVRTESTCGFAYFLRGEPVPNELAFLSADGTYSPGFEPLNDTPGWSARVCDIDPGGKAAQCLTLRRAILHWTHSIFDSYKNIAGEKFLMVMIRELQAQVRPWNWNIHIEPNGAIDDHFFPGAEAAAHSYRAILMGIGAQIGFALGTYLTQRILNEMFNELENEERASLETHRLIPAAFS